jgi:hypothetical protein
MAEYQVDVERIHQWLKQSTKGRCFCPSSLPYPCLQTHLDMPKKSSKTVSTIAHPSVKKLQRSDTNSSCSISGHSMLSPAPSSDNIFQVDSDTEMTKSDDDEDDPVKALGMSPPSLRFK